MSMITINPTTSNQEFSHTKFNEKHKIDGKFYGLQEQEIKDMKQHGFITTTGYVHLILRFLNPYFDKALHINVPKFLKKWNVAKSSFHKAIAKLCQTGIITLGTDKEIIFTDNPHQNDPSQNGDTNIISEISVSSQSNVSQVDSTLSQIRDNSIYIDRACGQTNKTNTDLDQTVGDSDRVRAVNIETDSNNSEGEQVDKFVSEQGEDLNTEPLAKTQENNSLSCQKNLDPGLDQASGACSTNVNKASDNTTTTESHKDTTYMGSDRPLSRRSEKLESPKPKPNVPKSAYDASLEYEQELNKKPWQKIDFTPEDEAKIKHLQRYTQNPYERPWRDGRVNYIKNLIPTLQKLNSWYLKPENRGKGYERGHLENLEKAIADWENKPFQALEAYDKMMEYVAKCQDGVRSGLSGGMEITKKDFGDILVATIGEEEF